MVAIVVENQNCPKIKNSTYCNINNTQTLVHRKGRGEQRRSPSLPMSVSAQRHLCSAIQRCYRENKKSDFPYIERRRENRTIIEFVLKITIHTRQREGVVYLVDCKKVTTRNLFSVLHDVLPFEAFHLYFYI